MLPLVSSALYLSFFLYFNVFLSLFFCPPLRVLLCHSALPMHGFKEIHSHGCSIPLPLPVGLPATASPRVPCSALSSRSQGVATCPSLAVPTCFVGSILLLRHGMSLLPPWQSNRTLNLYKLWLNPPSIPFSPLDIISAVRSGASRSDSICTFRLVDLLDR